MANFTTSSDLRVDSLWMAGEPSSGTTSGYYSRALDYQNIVLTCLIAGGALGAITFPKMDWWWARSATPGWVTILDAFNDNAGTTVTLTQDSTTFSLSAAYALSLTGYRIVVSSGSADQIAYVSAHTAAASTGTLSLAWKPATVATTSAIAYKNTYDLPTDFAKFSTSLRCSRSPYEIPLVDIRDLEKEFPRNRVWIGTPMAAALLIGTSAAGYTIPALHFSHAPTDGPWVIEFEYLKKQTALTGSTDEPPIPHQHRRILSLGAAYLMLVDKNDARQAQIGGMFRDAWDAMSMDEAQLGGNNDQYGRLLAFPGIGGNSQPLRTSSGLIIG